MNTVKMPLLSIVTPVHNEAAYLPECIESILAQTYDNWEYIIVDNCSTDDSAEIAHKYAARDRRIRVVTNSLYLPALANHNAALRQISPDSKYCKVVFGDDWIFPDCLERMVAVGEEHPSAGVIGAYGLQGRQVMWTGLPYPSTLVCGRKICRAHLLEGLYVFGSATSLLYRADLVRSHDPFYNESNIHGDTEACFALLKTSDFGFVHQVLTFTRVRPASLSNTSSDLQTYFGGMLQTLVTHGPEYLARDEFQTCLGRHLTEYYAFLAKSLLLGRDEMFWQYHKKTLADTGFSYSLARLAKAMVARSLSAALTFGRQRLPKLLGGSAGSRKRDSRATVDQNTREEEKVTARMTSVPCQARTSYTGTPRSPVSFER